MLIAVFVIVAVAAAINAMTGFGFALVGVPLLALAIGARDAVVLLAILTLPMNVGLAWRHRDQIVLPTAKRQTAAAFLGMPLGLVVLLAVTQQVLLAVISVAVLATVVALVRGVELHPHGPRLDYGSGFVSGVLATSIGVNGPPLVEYEALALPILICIGNRLPTAGGPSCPGSWPSRWAGGWGTGSTTGPTPSASATWCWCCWWWPPSPPGSKPWWAERAGRAGGMNRRG